MWEIAKPTKVKEEGKPKLKVKVRLNLHGIVAVESVVQVEEEEYEETVKKAPSAPAKVSISSHNPACAFCKAFFGGGRRCWEYCVVSGFQQHHLEALAVPGGGFSFTSQLGLSPEWA